MSKKTKIICVVLGWQVVVYALSVAGVFADIFSLLGIPWNSVGWRNVLGTTVGLVLVELPLLFFLGWLWMLKKRQERRAK
jgi:hypothetical protein